MNQVSKINGNAGDRSATVPVAVTRASRSRLLSAIVFAAFSGAAVFAQDATPTPTPEPSPQVKVEIPRTNPPTQFPETPPVAPNFSSPNRPFPSSDRVGVDNSNQLPLSLREAIALALKNNNDIGTSRIDLQIAEYNLKAARSIFDPAFNSDTFYESRTTPTSSTISGGSNGSVQLKTVSSSSNIGGFSPFSGGSYQASFASSRTVTNNQFATLNPQFPSSLGITYIQPLWRGLRFDANRYNIEIAKKNVNLSDAEFRRIATEVVAQVEQSYWDLVFSLRNLQVQIDAVRTARLQLESNQRLVKQGVLAPVEIYTAEVQVTTYEQNVYIAQENVTRAENVLKTLLLPDRTAEMWSRPLTPVTPVELEAPQPTLQEAVSSALQNRAELSQTQTNIEKNAIATRYFRELTKPQVNLYGGYTASGLAGANTGVSNTVPDNLIGGIGKSLSNIIGQDYPTYRFGVTISLPFGNGVAKANLGASLAEGNQVQILQKKAEQGIEAEVRNALQALRSAEARLNAAAASRAAAEQVFASEQRQFRAGTSTVFLVQQRQNELIVARGNELQAQTALNKAISEYQRSTGMTLTVNNVEINAVK